MKRVSIVAGAVGALALFGATCTPGVSIPVVTKMPDKIGPLMEGKRNVGIIAVKNKQDFLTKFGIKTDWTKTIQGAVVNAFDKWGYFRLVDLESRREQLEQLAHSASGMTTGVMSIGQQLNADGLVFIDMTNQPLQECKVESIFDPAAAALAAMDAVRGTGGNREVKKPTGVLYLTIFVRARLVRTTTGQMTSYQNKDPFKLESSIGDTNCPSTLDAFGRSMDMAGERIADRLSPKVETIKVPIATDPVGAPDKMASRVEKYLEQGVRFIKAKPANFERASESFNKALEDSGQKSASAFWNLAVVRWAQGDMNGADEYFKKAERAGGPDWLTDNKIEVINRFSSERKRKDKEADAE